VTRPIMPSTTPVTWAVIGGIGFLVARHFELSPSVVMLLTLFAVLLFGSKRPAGAAEHFTPVFVSSVVAGLQAGVASIQGRRQYMEDIHQTIAFNAHEQPNAARVGLTHFFAVYDGHGGKRAAAWAQQHLVSNLLRELAQDAAPPPGASSKECAEFLDSAVVDAFHRTDADFLRHAASRGIPDGSTAVTCMIQSTETHGVSTLGSAQVERRLLIANLGDSRCVMVRTDGSAIALSSDHKPNRPDERARVQAAGGSVIYAGCWRVQGDLAVSRAFGDAHLKPYGVSATPELSAVSLSPRDCYLVLASDGLWDVVDEQQCAASVLRATDPLRAARSLCDLASSRGSMDNITVLVVAL